MPKLCIVTYNPYLIGGVRSLLLEYLHMAGSLGCTCDIYFPFSGEYPNDTVSSMSLIDCVDNVYPVRIWDKIPHFMRYVMFSRRCQFLRDYAAYVMVTNDLAQGLPLMKQDKPFIAWIATTNYDECRYLPKTKLTHYMLYNRITAFFTRRQEIRIGNRASYILPISHNSARIMQLELNLPPEKIRVVSMPVDIEKMQPKEGPVNTDRYILCVGRLDRRKDHVTLIKAFKQVSEKVKDVKLRIAGAGVERSSLERVVKQLSIDSRVNFLGLVSDEELVEQYRNASLFSLTSLQEGMGLVFVEAMAYGLPVVATDSGGSADPIDHGVTGFLVQVGDWQSLADYISTILEDEELSRRMGSAGRKRVVEHFSFPVIERKMAEILKEVYSDNLSLRHTSG